MDEFRRSEDILKSAPPTPSPKSMKMVKQRSKKLFPCSMCSQTLHFKSKLYAHYALVHFRDKLLERFRDLTNCPFCNKRLKSIDYILTHMGSVHNHVEQFLDSDHHVKKTHEKTTSLPEDHVSCYLCTFTTSNKKDLYMHYSLVHFKEQLIKPFENDSTCPVCSTQLSSDMTENILHIGVTCGYIENCLPIQLHAKNVVAEEVAKQTNPTVNISFVAENVENIENLSPKLCIKKLSNAELNDSNDTSYKCSLDCTYTTASCKLLLQHYAFSHFRQKLIDEFGKSDTCPDCDQVCPSQLGKVSHMHKTHNFVEKYLKEDYDIEIKDNGPVVHRCYICSFTSSNRSRIYSHYARKHFKVEILKKYPEKDFCQHCSMIFKSEHSKLVHLACTHNAVELFMKQEHRISKVTHSETNTEVSIEGDVKETPDTNSVYNCSRCEYSNQDRYRMYVHYAGAHFKQEIHDKYPEDDFCSICNKAFINKHDKVHHLGSTHSAVDLFLEKEFIIPKKLPFGNKVKEDGSERGEEINHSFSSNSTKTTLICTKDENDETAVNSVHTCFACDYSSSMRSRMYSHYAKMHFKDKIIALYPEEDSCAICGKILLSEGTKLVHLGSTHSVVDQFLQKSHIIPKRSVSMSNMESSILEDEIVEKENVSNQTVYSCFSCEYTNSIRKKMYSHYARKHFKDKILTLYPEEDLCTICGKIFNSEGVKLDHLAGTHSVVDQFLKKSHIIEKYSRNQSNMDFPEDENSQNNKDYNQTLHSCFNCEYSSPVRYNMYLHYARKHLKDDILTHYPGDDSCSECGTMFINESAKLEHLTSKHNAVDLFLKKSHIIPKGNHLSLHKCHVCDFETSKRHNIYKHYSLKHYKKQFKQAYNLNVPCQMCGFFQSPRQKVIQHLGATHDLVEQFLPKQYHIPQSKRHPKKTLLSNPLQCSKCDTLAENVSCLYKHYALKHFRNSIIKKFGILENCSICDLKFSSKSHQVSHLGMKHRIVEKYLKKRYHLPLNYKGKKDINSTIHQLETSIKNADKKKVHKLIDPISSKEGPTIEGETFEVYMDIGEESEQEIEPDNDDLVGEEDEAARDSDNLSEKHFRRLSGLEPETVKKIREDESDDDTNNDMKLLDVPPEDSDEDDSGNCNGKIVLDVDDSYDEEDSDSEEVDIDEGIYIKIDASGLAVQIKNETDLDSDDKSAYADDQADMDKKEACVYLESRDSEANLVGANVFCTIADTIGLCEAYTIKGGLKEKHAREEETLDAYSWDDNVKNAEVVKSKDENNKWHINDEDCDEAAHERDKIGIKNDEENTTMDEENAATDDENTAMDEENAATGEENSATGEENSATDEENAPTNKENAPTDKDSVPANEENAATDEDNAGTDEENVASDEENSATDEENAPSDKETASTYEEDLAIYERIDAAVEDIKDDVNKSKVGNNPESARNKSVDSVERHDNQRKEALSTHLVSQVGIDLPSLQQRVQESRLKAVNMKQHVTSTVDEDMGFVTDKIYEAESVKTANVDFKINDLELSTKKDKSTVEDEGMKNIEDGLKYRKVEINNDKVESRTNEDGSEVENVKLKIKEEEEKEGQEKKEKEEKEEKENEKAAELEITPAKAGVQFVVKIEPGLRKVIDYREICFIESDSDSGSESDS